MPAIVPAIVLACAAIIPGCTATAVHHATTPAPPAPVEHIIYDGDTIPMSPPDILTIRIPGADAYDEPYYREYCADMGGEFQVRMLPGDDPDEAVEPEVVCYDVDY